jgi:hypothetical protein
VQYLVEIAYRHTEAGYDPFSYLKRRRTGGQEQGFLHQYPASQRYGQRVAGREKGCAMLISREPEMPGQ